MRPGPCSSFWTLLGKGLRDRDQLGIALPGCLWGCDRAGWGAQGQAASLLPTLGEGGPPSPVPSLECPAQHPMENPSPPRHNVVIVLDPTLQMERQRLGRDRSQVTCQWMKASDPGRSGCCGPHRATVGLPGTEAQHEHEDTREGAPKACFLPQQAGRGVSGDVPET